MGNRKNKNYKIIPIRVSYTRDLATHDPTQTVPCATQRVLVDHNTPWGCGEGAPQPECRRVLGN